MIDSAEDIFGEVFDGASSYLSDIDSVALKTMKQEIEKETCSVSSPRLFILGVRREVEFALRLIIVIVEKIQCSYRFSSRITQQNVFYGERKFPVFKDFVYFFTTLGI